jgi:hypothetical protein
MIKFSGDNFKMRNAVKNLAVKNSPANPSSARVVDGKLILSYPDAITPVVWQMDLAQARASALEVRENDKGHFVLTLKTIKGESAEVAPFETKAAAVDALMAAGRALETAQGHIRPADAASPAQAPQILTLPQQQAKRGNKWAAGLLAALMIAFLIGMWGSIAPRAPMSVDNAANGPTGAASPSLDFGAKDEAGVPLSADEFLLKQQK